MTRVAVCFGLWLIIDGCGRSRPLTPELVRPFTAAVRIALIVDEYDSAIAFLPEYPASTLSKTHRRSPTTGGQNAGWSSALPARKPGFSLPAPMEDTRVRPSVIRQPDGPGQARPDRMARSGQDNRGRRLADQVVRLVHRPLPCRRIGWLTPYELCVELQRDESMSTVTVQLVYYNGEQVSSTEPCAAKHEGLALAVRG